jgi:predicted ATPase/DNA-binding CsgD family transcriptional regulator
MEPTVMDTPTLRDARTAHLPAESTPFIGRRQETAGIRERLGDPACRALTLVGPGGTGKTRLAIRAASKLARDFPDGVFFIDLQSAGGPGELLPAIADAIDLPRPGTGDPRRKLLEYLHDREMLLVLDNFEHMLAGVDLLIDILDAAPGVKLLVTSREVLNIRHEWLFPVGGMPYPDLPSAGDVTTYGAVQLFLDRARRVRPGYEPGGDLDDVVRICRLVDGLPLAIELAASWLKALDADAITGEITHNLDFLQTRLRDVPERHRSMRAVFQASWELLTEGERAAFKRLSVFRGAFSREAAEAVAGASLATLSALVDKSLLSRRPGGRYHIHELLRQYGRERLAESPGDVARTHDRHGAYYTRFLRDLQLAVDDHRQFDAIRAIDRELPDVRAAWQWAVEGAHAGQLGGSIHALGTYFHVRSRFLEGAEMMADAAAALADDEDGALVLADVLGELGWLTIRLGRLDEAREAVERSMAIYDAHRADPTPGIATDPTIPLAILCVIGGDYAEAITYGEAALERADRQGDRPNRSAAHYALIGANLAAGNVEAAGAHAEAACNCCKEAGERWFLAYCLNERGKVAQALGDFDRARRDYEASYAIREEAGDPEGMAVALNLMGELALDGGDYGEAADLYRRSLAIYRDILDRGGLASALNGLGRAAAGQGDREEARRCYREALEIAGDMGFVPLLLSLLLNAGELLSGAGREAEGIELLAHVQNHPASGDEQRARAAEVIARYEGDTANTPDGGGAPDLQAAAARAVDALDPARPFEVQTVDDPAMAANREMLVEPLTERELEVLGLIDTGLTNRQIGETLIISTGTVKWYTSQIYGKLGVSRRTEALARARELGLLR